MKHLKFLLIIALCTFSFSNAQIRFGAKAGVNSATLSSDGDDNFDSKIGLNFGAVAKIYISDFISLQPELSYSAQGYRQTFNGQDVVARIDYFNLPLLIDYAVVEGLSLQAGPQLGFNIRSEFEVDNQEPQKIFANDVDISAVFGLQYNFESDVFIQAKYALGLSEVAAGSESKHRVISLGVGIFFDRPSSNN